MGVPKGVFDDDDDGEEFDEEEETGPVQTELALPPPAAGSYLDEVFGPGGYLAQASGPSYEMRPGQLALAKLIDRVIAGEQHALAEGPCGTGKGLAYLVPAIYHAVHSGKTIVVATANIALQDQLLEKDLPALAAALPWQFKFRGLKGRSNYFCNHKADLSEASGELRSGHEVTKWGRVSETGDKKELPMLPSDDTWSLVSTSSEDCLGDGCDYFPEGCHYEVEKRKAREAGIVVTNLHVLGAHLSLRQQTDMDLILPAFDVCIVDEAHELPGAMREFFGFSLTERNIQRVSRTIRNTMEGHGKLADMLERAAYHFFDAVAAYARPKGTRLRLVNATGFCDAAPLLQALGNVASAASNKEMEEMARHEKMGLGQGNTQNGKLAARLKGRVEKMIVHISKALAQEDPENSVYWIDFHAKDVRRNHPRIESRPIKVAGILNQEFFARCPTVALVSATLTTTPGDFGFIRGETGIPREALELCVPSPFDLQNACIAILPEKLPGTRTNLPSPDDKDFSHRLAPFFEYVMKECDGRTLGLFTSYRNLEDVRAEVSCDHPILVQERGGGMSRSELVRRFKADTHTCLFGTDSFWTGIDVVGESLIAVVIDKIPFEHQDDPLIAAMKEKTEDEFWGWYTNRAIIKLRQGVGRLIRSQSDIGVIVILDERIKTKKYGLRMAKSLGPMPKVRKLEAIRPFLANARANVKANHRTFQDAQKSAIMEPVMPAPRTKMRAPKGVF